MLELLPSFICVASIFVFLVFPAWARMQWVEWRARKQRAEAIEAGRHEPVTIQPWINPGLCMGSGACVTACPEDVLRVIDGQAVVVDAAACVGHSACVAVCPVDAVELVFGSDKRGVDLPEVNTEFQTNVPGLYVAGELGGMGLIANAVEQGAQAMDSVAKALQSRSDRHDVIIVGAGPAGLSAALVAQQKRMRYLVLEQDEFGGAIRHYPRKKLVFGRPMDLRTYGRVGAKTMRKEQLIELFEEVVRKTKLDIKSGVRVDEITPLEDGGFQVRTSQGIEYSQRVLLAVGRRGTPRRLDVPGEDQEKVAYWLSDPELYRNNHILVVGGGDSAVEAAISLGEEPGNRVWLSYRKDKITRPKKKNLERLRSAVRKAQVELVLNSQVKRIGIDRVVLDQEGDELVLPNDFVFIFAGGVLPTKFLKTAGVRVRTHYGKRVALTPEQPESERPPKKERAPKPEAPPKPEPQAAPPAPKAAPPMTAADPMTMADPTVVRRTPAPLVREVAAPATPAPVSRDEQPRFDDATIIRHTPAPAAPRSTSPASGRSTAPASPRSSAPASPRSTAPAPGRATPYSPERRSGVPLPARQATPSPVMARSTRATDGAPSDGAFPPPAQPPPADRYTPPAPPEPTPEPAPGRSVPAYGGPGSTPAGAARRRTPAPAPERPASSRPVAERPASSRPVAERPASGRPADLPAYGRPAGARPASPSARPVPERPSPPDRLSRPPAAPSASDTPDLLASRAPLPPRRSSGRPAPASPQAAPPRPSSAPVRRTGRPDSPTPSARGLKPEPDSQSLARLLLGPDALQAGGLGGGFDDAPAPAAGEVTMWRRRDEFKEVLSAVDPLPVGGGPASSHEEPEITDALLSDGFTDGGGSGFSDSTQWVRAVDADDFDALLPSTPSGLREAERLRDQGHLDRAVEAYLEAGRQHAKAGATREVLVAVEQGLATLAEATRGRRPALSDDEAARFRLKLLLLRAEASVGTEDWDGALEALEQAVAAGVQADEPADLAQALGALGRTWAQVGRQDLSEAVVEEGWYRATSPEGGRATAARALAALHLGRGQLDEAEHRYTEAWDLALAARSSEAEARARRGMADVRVLQGRLVDATELLGRSRTLLEQGGDVRIRAVVLSRSVEIHTALGRYGLALQDAEGLIELARRGRLANWLPEATAQLGHALVAVGFRDVAEDAANLSLDALRSSGFGPWSWRARIDVARLLCAVGWSDKVAAVLDPVTAVPESPLDDPAAQLGAVRARALAPKDAATARELALATLQRPRPLHPLRGARARLDAAWALMLAGEPEEARDAVKRGLELLQDVEAPGARLELLVALYATRPEDRVLEAVARAARRIVADLPAHHADAFRERRVIEGALKQPRRR